MVHFYAAEDFSLQRPGTQPDSWTEIASVGVALGLRSREHFGVMNFSCDGLAQEWDAIQGVRERLRAGKPLVDMEERARDATIKQCCGNLELLQPMLHRLVACGCKLPDINGLREEVSQVYALSARTPAADVVDDDAWDIRKMLRYIKRKAQRQEVTTDTWHMFA